MQVPPRRLAANCDLFVGYARTAGAVAARSGRTRGPRLPRLARPAGTRPCIVPLRRCGTHPLALDGAERRASERPPARRSAPSPARSGDSRSPCSARAPRLRASARRSTSWHSRGCSSGPPPATRSTPTGTTSRCSALRAPASGAGGSRATTSRDTSHRRRTPRRRAVLPRRQGLTFPARVRQLAVERHAHPQCVARLRARLRSPSPVRPRNGDRRSRR